MEWNEDVSQEIRKELKKKKVLLINVMGSPGAGKTSFIIEIIKKLKSQYNMAVVEGDLAGQVDAEKIDKLGIPVVQLNTEGACHIEAMSIKNILEYFDLDNLDIVFVENIGNLVCPAEFDIGENLKIALLSIPEGDDKVIKYPLIFSESNILILNKFDMINKFDFDKNKVKADALRLNPKLMIQEFSSVNGQGLEETCKFIKSYLLTCYGNCGNICT